MRASLQVFFAVWHEPHFQERRLLVGDEHWVLERTLEATARGIVAADGVAVSFEGVDVIAVRDGLVASKDGYIDGLAAQRQLQSEA